MDNSRRKFIRKTALGATGISAGLAGSSLSAKSYGMIKGANDRINMGVIGTRGQGFGHLKRWASMAKNENVYVKTICDVDENLWPERVKEIEKIQNVKPDTEFDMRKVFDDKKIDAVSIATPNHWHALASIWAIQAGKDVYVEKPSNHNVWEGRRMIEEANNHNRIVQVGFQNRSIQNVRKAMQFLHNGGIGDVYMARGLCFKPRDSFNTVPDSEIPAGIHYDNWVGPAKMYPFNKGKFHYNWHWFWDTGNGDIGNQGPHQWDIARWGLNQKDHPVKISSKGGYYKWKDCKQETANTQTAVMEYSDGRIIQFEVRGLYTAGEDSMSVKIGNLFYGTEGWMEVNGSSWKTYMGRKGEPGPSSDSKGTKENEVSGYLAAPGGGGHYHNFIAAIRSGNKSDLTCPVEEGVLSSDLPLLANISYRLGRDLTFHGKEEKFAGDMDANKMLTREYREPYLIE